MAQGREVVELVKNHAGAGYHVDVQGSEAIKNALMTALKNESRVSYEWNQQSTLSTETGFVLTI
jgi:hypothetical protein